MCPGENVTLVSEHSAVESGQRDEVVARRIQPRLESCSQLSTLRKGDSRKVWLAMLLRKRTVASNAWIARRLAMGEAGSVSRLIGQAKADSRAVKKLKELEGMLK